MEGVSWNSGTTWKWQCPRILHCPTWFIIPIWNPRKTLQRCCSIHGSIVQKPLFGKMNKPFISLFVFVIDSAIWTIMDAYGIIFCLWFCNMNNQSWVQMAWSFILLNVVSASSNDFVKLLFLQYMWKLLCDLFFLLYCWNDIFLVETWLRIQCFLEDLQRDIKFPDMDETWFYTKYKSFVPLWLIKVFLN